MRIPLKITSTTSFLRLISIRYSFVIFLSLFNILFCFLLEGHLRFLSTFLMSVGIILVVFSSTRINISPLQAWCLGFIFLVAPEGIFDAANISLLFGERNYSVASLFICLAFSGICLMVGVINFLVLPKLKTPASTLRLPTKLTYFSIYTMYIIYVLYSLPYAYLTFSRGRVEALLLQSNRTLLDAILGTIASISGVTLVAAITYIILQEDKSSYRMKSLKLILTILPILAIQFFSGVRSSILSTVLSVGFVYFIFYPLRVRQIPFLLTAMTGFFFVTEVMKNSRLGGGESLRRINIDFSIESLYEGTIRYFTSMVGYFDSMGYRDGLEHLTLLLFWVPRAVWHDKPAQLENWFHQVTQPGHFPYFHSIAATFGATGFADFGFAGGLFMTILLQGCLLGFFERRVSVYVRNRVDHIGYDVVLYASALGLTLYSVRQFNSVPVGLAILILSYGLIMLTFKR